MPSRSHSSRKGCPPPLTSSFEIALITPDLPFALLYTVPIFFLLLCLAVVSSRASAGQEENREREREAVSSLAVVCSVWYGEPEVARCVLALGRLCCSYLGLHREGGRLRLKQMAQEKKEERGKRREQKPMTNKQYRVKPLVYGR